MNIGPQEYPLMKIPPVKIVPHEIEKQTFLISKVMKIKVSGIGILLKYSRMY